MNNLSRSIEQYILSRLDDEPDNFISLRRKDLAEMFECVPSQINYVLRSRFRPEHGFIIDSRRGEHGYIKIVKITCVTPEERVNHAEDLIGDSISFNDAHRLLESLLARDLITNRERLLMEISLRHLMGLMENMSPKKSHEMFAELLKRMLKGLMLVNDPDAEPEED